MWRPTIRPTEIILYCYRITNDRGSKMNTKDSTGRKKRMVQTAVMTVACVVLGIVIAFQYKSIQESERYTSTQLTTINDYQAQIINLSNEIDLLTSENTELQSKLQLIDSGTNEEQIANLKEELAALKKFAGVTKVTGPGVRVTVEFKEAEKLSSASAAIQMLINEIKAADAQAISINGERIIATSEIRVVNSYIVINGRTYTQPLEILVIGKQSSLNSMLNMAGGIVSVLQSRYNAAVNIETQDEIVINAYAGSTELIGVK